MILSDVLTPRRAIGVLALLCATLGTSGCGGGWGESRPAINASLTKGSQTVSAGQTATMTVTPTGTGPFNFQWYRNGVPISGATSSTYSSQVSGSDNGAVFTVAISNAGGTVTSAPYTLTVNTPPSITMQPGSQTVTAGQAATFTITASGTGPFSYQWYRDGAPIGGAISSTLTVPATAFSDNGSQITVLVTNALGSTTSSAAILSVMPSTAGLTLASIPAQTYGSAPFVVGASSASDGALTYGVVSGPASVSGATVTVTGAGDVVISVTQAPSGNFPASTATATFHVAQGVPSLSFASVPAATFGAAAFPVSATSASTAPITYNVVSGPATISGSSVTVTGAGTVVLAASQAATTANYATPPRPPTSASTSGPQPRPSASRPCPPKPSATRPLPSAPLPAPLRRSPTASSAAPQPSPPAEPSPSPARNVTVTGAGTVVLAASQAATANYAAATANISFNVTAATPTLSFATIPAINYGTAAFPVSATSASSGTVTYSVVSGPATITSGGSLTITGAGTIVLSASQAATANYAAATANVSFNVGSATPALSFSTVPAQTFGNPAFTVSATSSSTAPVTYSVVSGPATVSPSGTVTVTGAGTVVLAASQAATANYAAATANISFNVTAATPTLSFATIPAINYGTAAFPVSATSASSGTVTYSVVSGPATITSGGSLTITGAGTIVLSASQAATANYAAATAGAVLTVTPATPTLSFVPISTMTYGATAPSVSATSASNGTVTYSVASGPATITPGGSLTITGAGTVVLSASQAASANYTAATANISFTVAPATPTLSFAPIPYKVFGAAVFPVSATSASTGAVTYSVVSGPATITNGNVAINGTGIVLLAANQAATANYAAATANTSFTVNPATPTLSLGTIANLTYGATSFTVMATSNSPASISYSLVSGPATVSLSGGVTITGAGTVTLSASQAASANYAAATANTAFTVNPATPNLTFTAIPAKTYGNPVFTANATSASSGAVTYSLVGGPATITPSGSVSLTGAGPVTLSATQAASGNYAAATTSTTFTVAPNVSISPITPSNQVLAPGQLGFSATAVGGQTDNLVWTATGGSFTGSTWTTPNMAGTYTIRATSADQSSVYVATTATVSAPVITAQPASQNVCTNASTTLSVAANYGSTYQWSLGGTILPGATSSSYFIAGAARPRCRELHGDGHQPGRQCHLQPRQGGRGLVPHLQSRQPRHLCHADRQLLGLGERHRALHLQVVSRSVWRISGPDLRRDVEHLHHGRHQPGQQRRSVLRDRHGWLRHRAHQYPRHTDRHQRQRAANHHHATPRSDHRHRRYANIRRRSLGYAVAQLPVVSDPCGQRRGRCYLGRDLRQLHRPGKQDQQQQRPGPVLRPRHELLWSGCLAERSTGGRQRRHDPDHRSAQHRLRQRGHPLFALGHRDLHPAPELSVVQGRSRKLYLYSDLGRHQLHLYPRLASRRGYRFGLPRGRQQRNDLTGHQQLRIPLRRRSGQHPVLQQQLVNARHNHHLWKLRLPAHRSDNKSVW